ncbi:MAG TPA: V-type ATP synthase subunit D [Bacillota bacterium]|jgi:V/A-type H+-transporting ATPase subunit D|nr:V-type ATP synthase subunit D [Bacillota bacterium]HRS21109.1 V-type ATP synthase subunit D [Clostridia bacterium]HRU40775.1 V-type ATP synthase subunit D [Candidatus Diapherotrites archaeon]HQE65738.1 V-type ATP synthase subunit D [Bacillota bacterium]HQI16539.1 V-type ATP synthase subunit D [Bacillota bacterium]
MEISYTKTSLIAAQNSLELSKKGYELLDKKRNVLIMTMMSFIEKAEEIQKKVAVVFGDAYEALQTANITMGISNIEQIAQSIPEASGFEILDKSIMGVEIPEIKHQEEKLIHYYSFYHTNTALDVAMQKFHEVKLLLYELSEIEDSVYKLAMEVKRTQKRTNALQNIQIPKYEEIVGKILEVLEEREREDFFRLKVVKKKGEKRAAK